MSAKKTTKPVAPLSDAGDREPVFPMMKVPVLVPVEFRNTTVYVGNGAKKAIEVNSPRAGKSLLSAADTLTRGIRYPVAKIGLHLHSEVAYLLGMPYCQDVGYLSAQYQPEGENDPFAALIPTNGWVRLGVNCGHFTAFPMVWVEPTEGEPESVRHTRYAIALNFYMDGLLNGFSFHIAPVFRKNDEGDTDPGQSLMERQLAFVDRYKAIWAMTDEEAAASYKVAVTTIRINQTYGREGAKMAIAAEKGEKIEVLASVPLRDGTKATLADLNGKIVRRWDGKGEVAGTIRINETSWPLFAKVIAVRNLQVEILD